MFLLRLVCIHNFEGYLKKNVDIVYSLDREEEEEAGECEQQLTCTL